MTTNDYGYKEYHAQCEQMTDDQLFNALASEKINPGVIQRKIVFVGCLKNELQIRGYLPETNAIPTISKIKELYDKNPLEHDCEYMKGIIWNPGQGKLNKSFIKFCTICGNFC